MNDGPRRTCIVCREVRNKWRLVRLVCRSDGTVVVDRTGRTSGRGAYVCGQPQCTVRLGKGERLTQAFRRACRPEADLTSTVEAVRRALGGDTGTQGAIITTNSINLMSAR